MTRHGRTKASSRLALMTLVTALLVALACLLSGPAASAQGLHVPQSRVAAIGVADSQLVGAHYQVLPGQRRQTAPSYDQTVVGSSFGAEGEGAGGLSEAFHYTGEQNAATIEEEGLRPGSYATPNGELSPLQAQIDLALPPNRGLPGALIRIDLEGLRQAGYEIPEVTQVGRSFNLPGGGYEMQFPYEIPPEYLKVVRP